MKRFTIILACLGAWGVIFAQSGKNMYGYLDVPVSARMAALGGTNVSIMSHDLTSAFQNPALLTSRTHNTLSLNYASYLANTMFGSAAYGYNYKDNYFGAGISYVDYGKFQGADEVGTSTGTFTAKDFAVNLMYARKLNDIFTVGATLKPLYSAYERYTAFGMAIDMGAHLTLSEGAFTAGLVFRNAGVQIKGFHDDEDGGQHRDPLPFDIQLGISGKFKHAPLRLSLTLHNLQRWNLGYELTNQSITSLDGTTTAATNDIHWVDMAFRHAIFAIDFVPGKNFYLTASYNHRRNRELLAAGYKSISGFGFGAGINVYKFQIGFGMAQYQLGNYAYHFSFTTHLDDFKDK